MSEITSLLNGIDSPEDLKKIPVCDLPLVADEVRKLIIETVSQNGGHLASSLGVTDLTIALHYVFQMPEDRIVWDVGHQAYCHKILTGRRERFKTLRQDDGISGFPDRNESDCDAFIAGHAGTAVSAALGMAAARDLKNQNHHVIAVVGDGSLSCGISQEALNNVTAAAKRMIIILNDNRMSISANVGAMTRYLNKLIGNRTYNRVKTILKRWLRPVDPGDNIRNAIRRTEEAIKRLIMPSIFFEELGIRYMGPIDGHHIAELVQVFEQVKSFEMPVLIHVVTTKGKGYDPARIAPEKFHGLSKFDLKTGVVPLSKPSFSSAFGMSMIELCKAHDEVYAITAAMRSGTGLHLLHEVYPDRVMDVGIAEEHAAVFAGGLSVSGIRPVVALYATFLQRAFDPLFHDICLQNLPVIFCCDRAGAVDDGPTHHGIHDLSFLLTLPNLAVLQPKDEMELRSMLFSAYACAVPVVIRYPRGGTGRPFDQEILPEEMTWGKSEVLREGADLVIYGLGREVWTALEVASILAESGIECTVVNPRFLSPFDTELLDTFKQPIVTIEDHVMDAGLAALVSRELLKQSDRPRLLASFGWPSTVVPHGTVGHLRRCFNMEPDLIAADLLSRLNR